MKNKLKSFIYIFSTVILLNMIFISCNNETKNKKEEPVPYSSIKNMHKEELMDWNKRMVEFDHDIIDKFIERRKWKMETTETGLYWQIYSQTDGEQATSGKIAEFSYKTYLLNGEMLYTSDEYGNRFLQLDRNDEEFGLNEGIKMMKVGEKARFILPPHLAFGVTGDGYKVPIYSILVYEVELISLSQPQNENDVII